jgi:hypothetical protein
MRCISLCQYYNHNETRGYVVNNSIYFLQNEVQVHCMCTHTYP